MKNRVELEYSGYKVVLAPLKKGWECRAYLNDNAVFSFVHLDRETVVQMVQDEIDLREYAADDSVQITNIGLHEWLSSK